ncbi:MAG TPA: SDR family oxidoreductase [Vicinamibacteria bacterium]
MAIRRVLVTGAAGLLGGRVAALLARRFDTVAARHTAEPPPGIASVDLDLLDPASLVAALERARPDAVVHCAAQGNPDRCEREPRVAERLNVEATLQLARACGTRGLRLASLSTDLVFAGDRSFAREEDPPGPPLVYGRTKLAGEDAVLAEAPGAAVLRLALVAGRGYGAKATSTEAVAWALRAGRPLRLYTDQFRTPVDSDSVAEAVARALERPVSGLFHLGGPERLSRYELGLRVARVLGLSDEGIVPVTVAEMPQEARRPADTSLDSSRARRELGWEPRGLTETIRDGRPAPG